MIDGAGPTKLAIGIMMPVARSACDVTARYRGLALQIPLVGSILQVAFMSLSRPCTRRGGCGINEKDQICRKFRIPGKLRDELAPRLFGLLLYQSSISCHESWVVLILALCSVLQHPCAK
jgi:hypothetical protein